MHNSSHDPHSVLHHHSHFIIQWSADSVNDMYADAVQAVILQVESNPLDYNSECISARVYIFQFVLECCNEFPTVYLVLMLFKKGFIQCSLIVCVCDCMVVTSCSLSCGEGGGKSQT